MQIKTYAYKGVSTDPSVILGSTNFCLTTPSTVTFLYYHKSKSYSSSTVLAHGDLLYAKLLKILIK